VCRGKEEEEKKYLQRVIGERKWKALYKGSIIPKLKRNAMIKRRGRRIGA